MVFLPSVLGSVGFRGCALNPAALHAYIDGPYPSNGELHRLTIPRNPSIQCIQVGELADTQFRLARSI